jgi:hydroxyacylglutathione hydrolase
MPSREVGPFLRCDQPAVVRAGAAHGAASAAGSEVFAALRRWKNEFR